MRRAANPPKLGGEAAGGRGVADEVGVEVWAGGVNTWECDEMGHLNVRFYVAKAMEGLAGLAAELGMPQAFSPEADSTLVVREQHIRFLREARPNAVLAMTGSVVEMGESEARLLLVMRHLSGEPAATFQVLVSHATSGTGAAFPWPQRIRDRAAALTAPVPAYAAARSLAPTPATASTASLARADELGLVHTGQGAVGPQDCDVFGRMRAELFMGRISDGIRRLVGETRPGSEPGRDGAAPRIGGAALEYRLAYFAWPRAGDRLALRSATTWTDARFRRLVHWLLDPATGRPWAAAEAITASFDLDARKIVTLSPRALAAVEAQVIPGLEL